MLLEPEKYAPKRQLHLDVDRPRPGYTTGGRALDLLRTEELPSVIVCGDWKAGLSAAEFIQRLRAAPATSRLPVLRMSPEGSSSIAGRDGSDATIGSPFRLLELGDKLVRLQDPRS